MSDYLPLLRSPGHAAVVDDQGPLATCTRFALSKGICDGFFKKRWIFGKSLDIDQDSVSLVLLQEHKDTIGKWPEEFDKKQYQFQEKKLRSYWDTKVEIEELKGRDIQKFIAYISSAPPAFSYLLVYRNKQNELHCVYIADFDKSKQELYCLNSHGVRNPNPFIPLLQRDL